MRSKAESSRRSRRRTEPAVEDPQRAVLGAWDTNVRVTSFLFEVLPDDLWEAPVPGVPRKSIRTIAAHLHNSRRAWTRTLGRENGIAVPESVDRLRVRREKLLSVLPHSGAGIRALLELGLEHGGRIPAPPAYVWRNLPLDVAHVLAYFAAHEAHHRGQILLIARQLGRPLARETSGELWEWTRRSREAAAAPAAPRRAGRR